MSTVAQALDMARALGIDRLDARLLLAHVLARDRAWLIAHADETLDGSSCARFEALARRRAAGEPLAYLTGTREFHGLALQVDSRVLDPRPDTETLVDWAIELLSGAQTSVSNVLDLGTGSGAIALALKHTSPTARVFATDVSTDSLAVARGNARRLGLAVEFLAGEWWQAVEGLTFDLVVSNPPYVRADDPHLAALRHEPARALTPGPTGLEAFEQIVGGACERLAPGAWLLLEHGWDQARAVRLLLERYGFVEAATRCDLAGRERCSGARRPPE